MTENKKERAKQLEAIKQKIETRLPETIVHLQYKPPVRTGQPQIIVTIANRNQDFKTQLEFSFEVLKRLALEGGVLQRSKRPTPYTWEDLLHLLKTTHHLQAQS